ncbi:ATPase [Syntrophobotulus glycolicus DSM 8271]|uniref:ATPase n=1 Tax=Syntrophobotulus glycolicus (strain DSM 8271 / FlGlyR) TaxID=645991 RepID=F0SUH9_SYNGF|nr:ATPase [Syntrophobotulus glycolicus DSM 8271]
MISLILRPMYIEKIMPYVDTPFVKVLSGVRRCGKSTIVKMIAEELRGRGIPDERILAYNFDSLQHEDIKTAKLLYDTVKGQLSKDGKTYLFLDEIQEVKSWEKAVNSFMTDFDVDIYVTGSNSRMMSSEISTYLTGRYISFRIFPLSFAEYLSFRKEYTSLGDIRLELARYLRLGGFPAVHLQEYTPDEAYTIVKDIYNSTIFTDIVKRNQIRKVDQLERIVRFAFNNVGRTFSASSIAKYLKNEQRSIDNETVYNYLSKLESAFILHRCSRFDIQGKEILKTQEKFFLSDPAFRYSVLGYTPDSVAAMLENLVYLELLRRGYEVTIGKLDNAEIDFVATKQENKLYIQIAERIEREETQQREYGRLLGIADNYPKYVLLADEFAGGNYQGIKTMHIADFLLSEEY